MTACVICQSQELCIRVNGDIANRLDPSVIATRQRVRRSAVVEHTRHLEERLVAVGSGNQTIAAQAPMASRGPMETWWVAEGPGQPLRPVNEEYVIDAIALFKQAWQLANGDERTRQDMVQFIKDELVKDDMGIP